MTAKEKIMNAAAVVVAFTVPWADGIAGEGAIGSGVAEWFRQPSAVLSEATCVSDTNAFTCGSAPISCVHDGTIYAPYLTARSGHGEQHKIIALSVFAADRPSAARSFVIAEAGVSGPAADCSQVIDPFSVWHAGKVRVFFLADAEHYRYCDWDPVTETVGAATPVKCVWTGAATNELTSVPLAAYLTEKGCAGFNLQADASEHLICTAKPACHDGAFYGTVTSGSSQPVVFRCADGETFEFVGVVPVIGQYECQIAWLDDTLYALVRSAVNGKNFWSSSDGGATWDFRASIPMSATRPQLLAWRSRLLVGYSEDNVTPNSIRAGRNNMRLMAGTNTDFSTFEQAFRVVDPIGFVYYDLVPCGDELYCLWSNSSVYPDLGGTLSGKDAIFAARLSVSAAAPQDDQPVMAIPSHGGLDVFVDGSIINVKHAALVLAWDSEDRGASVADWPHMATIVPMLDPTGGTFRVDAAQLGLADGDCCRCFVVSACSLLTHLASTGTQYLDTGILHTQADVIDIDLRMDSFHDSKNSEIYGARDDGSGFKSVEAFSGYNMNKDALTTVDFCNTTASRLQISHGKTFDGIAGKRLKMHLSADGSRIRTDDGVIDVTGGAYAGSFALSRSAWVFGVNGANWSRHPGMTLYALDVARGGAPLRQFVPARNENDVPGLVDLVTEAFCANVGADDFVCGEVTNCFPHTTKSPIGGSAPVTISFESSNCIGRVTGWSGDYDGLHHSASVMVQYPKTGAVVRWAWTDTPRAGDFTHAVPQKFVRPGVYTNVVRITDATDELAPWVGTGVVRIVRRPFMAESVNGSIVVSVEPGVVSDGDALVLAWGSVDAGAERPGEWPHTAVLAELAEAGGNYTFGNRYLRRLGLQQGSACRVFAWPTCEMLDYAESSSSAQHVDLGIALKGSYTAEVVAEVPVDANVAGPFGVFGARASYNAANFSVGADQNCVYADNNDCRNSNRGNYQAMAKPLVKGERYRFHVGRPCAVSGAGSATASQSWDGSDFFTGSAWLFGINQGGAPAFSASTGVRICSCVVSNDAQELIVDARPAKDENGKVCIYEAVSDSFLPNVGSDLLAGPSIGRKMRTNASPREVSLPFVAKGNVGLCVMIR